MIVLPGHSVARDGCGGCYGIFRNHIRTLAQPDLGHRRHCLRVACGSCSATPVHGVGRVVLRFAHSRGVAGVRTGACSGDHRSDALCDQVAWQKATIAFIELLASRVFFVVNHVGSITQEQHKHTQLHDESVEEQQSFLLGDGVTPFIDFQLLLLLFVLVFVVGVIREISHVASVVVFFRSANELVLSFKYKHVESQVIGRNWQVHAYHLTPCDH